MSQPLLDKQREAFRLFKRGLPEEIGIKDSNNWGKNRIFKWPNEDGKKTYDYNRRLYRKVKIEWLFKNGYFTLTNSPFN